MQPVGHGLDHDCRAGDVRNRGDAAVVTLRTLAVDPTVDEVRGQGLHDIIPVDVGSSGSQGVAGAADHLAHRFAGLHDQVDVGFGHLREERVGHEGRVEAEAVAADHLFRGPGDVRFVDAARLLCRLHDQRAVGVQVGRLPVAGFHDGRDEFEVGFATRDDVRALVGDDGQRVVPGLGS
jgi:hypothetical protein